MTRDTERWDAEEALCESEDRLRLAVESTELGTWDFDPLTGELRWDDRCKAMFGLPPEAKVDYEVFLAGLHPEDRKRTDRAVQRSLDPASGSRYDIEYRTVGLKDGIERWVAARGKAFFDEAGRAVRFIGTVLDITERKRAEVTVRQREEIYRKGAEQASVMIFVVDLQTIRILESNAGRHHLLGYTNEELQHLTLYDLFTHDQEGIERNISSLMTPGGHFISEQMYRKDGSLIDVEVRAYEITSYDGKEAICIVARDTSESRQTEEKLRQSLDALLALYEGGHILGSTLKTEEVGSSLLQLMHRISRSVIAVISVPEEHSQQLRVWQAIGVENLWRRARYTSEVQATLLEVMKSGEHRSLELKHPDSTAKSLVGLFLPLRIRNRTIGVLEVYGPDVMAEKDIVNILLNLTVKAASALENAQLYGELAERERMLQELVGKLLRTQEEERRYVAYEVHDGLAQVASAAHQHLQAFSRRYSPTTERGQRELERVLNLVRQTVSEARKVIANLRPTALDDLGLAAAIHLEVERLHEEGYEVNYEDNLGDERLPTILDITLFRIIQEALTNFRKHAQTRHVRISIQRREEEVSLEVQDYGRGFDPNAASIRSGPGERVGLAGMQERVGMLNGKLKIHSRPGTGTSITAVIPLPATGEDG